MGADMGVIMGVIMGAVLGEISLSILGAGSFIGIFLISALQNNFSGIKFIDC